MLALKNQRGITGLETAIVLIAIVVVGSVFAFVAFSAGLFSAEKSTESTEQGVIIKGADAVLEAQLKRPDFLLQSDGIASDGFVLILEDWGRKVRPPYESNGLILSHVLRFDKAVTVPGGKFVPSDIRLGDEYRVLVGLAVPNGVTIDQTMRLTMAENLEILLEKGVTQVILVSQ